MVIYIYKHIYIYIYICIYYNNSTNDNNTDDNTHKYTHTHVTGGDRPGGARRADPGHGERHDHRVRGEHEVRS